MIAVLFSLVCICLLLSPKPAYAKEVHPSSQKAVATRKELSQKGRTILDTYENIKDFYAYDPETKKWTQIKNFKIVKSHIVTKKKANSTLDLTPYSNFWAHDAQQKKWHQVSLLSYLRPNEKKNPLSNKNSPPLRNAPKQTLLNELLYAYQHNPKQSNLSHTILSNFSLHLSVGTGLSFYRNELKKLTLYTKRNKNNKYYFVTDNKETYRPNWFQGVLTHLINFDPTQRHTLIQGSNNSLFQGKGWAIPIACVVKYTFVEKLFLAFGKEFLLKHVSELSHNDPKIQNKVLKLIDKNSAERRWLFQGGWYFFHSGKHKFFGDFSFFYVHHMAKKLHTESFTGDYIHKAYAFNPGIGYEKQLTGHLSWTTRLSAEWQQFKEFSNQAYNIMYRIPAIYLEFGLAIKLAKKRTEK